jgi:hypothetical protein
MLQSIPTMADFKLPALLSPTQCKESVQFIKKQFSLKYLNPIESETLALEPINLC